MGTGYETIIDPSTVVWTGLAVLIHIAMLVMQVALIAYLLVTAGLAFFLPEHDSTWTRRIGALRPDAMHLGRSSMIRTGAAMALALPVILGAHFAISLLATILVISVVVIDEMSLAGEWRAVGRYARHTAIASAAVLALFMVWEREDALALGTELIVTAQGWRMHEVDWQLENDMHTPRVGDMAPDFALQDPSGEVSVRLSDFRGKRPVALVFGSYT